MTWGKRALESIVGKGENAGYPSENKSQFFIPFFFLHIRSIWTSSKFKCMHGKELYMQALLELPYNHLITKTKILDLSKVKTLVNNYLLMKNFRFVPIESSCGPHIKACSKQNLPLKGNILEKGENVFKTECVCETP